MEDAVIQTELDRQSKPSREEVKRKPYNKEEINRRLENVDSQFRDMENYVKEKRVNSPGSRYHTSHVIIRS